jgi:hypothetical protein
MIIIVSNHDDNHQKTDNKNNFISFKLYTKTQTCHTRRIESKIFFSKTMSKKYKRKYKTKEGRLARIP